jgi:hypothetical protein
MFPSQNIRLLIKQIRTKYEGYGAYIEDRTNTSKFFYENRRKILL